MAKNVLIVESPTKEKTIKKYLPKNFIVASSYGHVRDLPAKSLGVKIADGFRPEYVWLPKAKKNVAHLKKLVSGAADVYLATDFDREGEAIAWHIADGLEIPESKIKRITFHEITKEAILKALKSPRGIDVSLVDAQAARRILDRLVGYKLSPLLWKKIAGGLSAGRVQSVA
ncbi:MAG: toprim domain-containing protein, partial [Endomicrobiia bacterium]|nr:toprim domain-containing protein [Endomicrobiia bacterium]